MKYILDQFSFGNTIKCLSKDLRSLIGKIMIGRKNSKDRNFHFSSSFLDNENVNEEKIDPSSSCSNEDTTTLKIKPENSKLIHVKPCKSSNFDIMLFLLDTRQTKVTHVCDTNNKDDIDAKNQEEESCECTICYLPLVENIDKVVLEECGHIFHSKVIESFEI